MTLDTEEVMSAAIKRMDEAYADLRKIAADEKTLNTHCTEMNAARVGFNDAVNAVFETRNAFHQIKHLLKNTAHIP